MELKDGENTIERGRKCHLKIFKGGLWTFGHKGPIRSGLKVT